MDINKDCENLFLEEVKKILEKSSDDLATFTAHWNAKEFRKAYLFIHEIIEAKKLHLPDSYKKVSEEFYWLYIA